MIYFVYILITAMNSSHEQIGGSNIFDSQVNSIAMPESVYAIDITLMGNTCNIRSCFLHNVGSNF